MSILTGAQGEGIEMYKQIIIARRDLEMSPGKLSAQVSHASMAFLTTLIRDSNNTIPMKKRAFRNWGDVNDYPDDDEIVCYDFEYSFDKDLYEQWINGEFTKCVLQAKNKNHLLKARNKAEEMGMKEGEDFFLIRDNCRTELEPEEFDENGVGRTLTCIGFRPMSSEIIDKIGKKYQLYK